MFQNIVIAGNVGESPTLNSGGAHTYCRFSVAVTERLGDKEETTWFRCTAFGKTAEAVAKHVTKGSKVLVSGKMRESQYTNSDGEERRSWALLADRVTFLALKDRAEGDKTPEPEDFPF